MAFEPGNELERVHKLRMVWIARPTNTMDGLERPRAKRVAREIEVRRFGRRWAELVSVVSAWAKGLAEEAWEEVWEEEPLTAATRDRNEGQGLS